MAIQFTGTYALGTPNTPIGSNQANFSAVLTFSVGSVPFAITSTISERNPGFTGAATAFGVGGASTVSLRIVGTSGQLIATYAVAASQFYQVAYRVAAGVAAIYVNGAQIASTNVGTGTGATNPSWVIGMSTGAPGQVITIQHVAFFENYSLELTPTNEVAGLLIGTITPATTGVPATVWWTLGGTTGHAPALGDDGLANSGTAGPGAGNEYVLGAVVAGGTGSAIYVPDLEYVSPINTIATVTKNGLLSFLFTNASTNKLAYATGVNTGLPPIVSVGGTPVTMRGPWWCNSTHELPEVFYSFPPGTITSSSQTVTYTIPFGTFTTTAGVSDQATSPAAVTNSFGTLEDVQGGLTSFVPNPTMKLGINIGYPPMFYYFGYSFSMNARLRFGFPNNLAVGQYVLNPNTLELSTVATNTWFFYFYFNSSANAVDGLLFPTPVGVHSIVFDDVNASSYVSPSSPGNALLATLVATTSTTIGADLAFSLPGTGVGNVALAGTATVTNGSTAVTLTTPPRSQTAMTWKFSTDSSSGTYKVVSGSGLNWVISPAFGGSSNSGLTVTTSGSTYLRTVAGNGTTVTVSYIVDFSAVPNYAHGYAGNLDWYFKTATGNWSANDPVSGTPTITNFWAFTPGDSLTTVYPGYSGPLPNASGNDRSDPYAISSTLRGWLTASNGNGPACVRFMEACMNYGAAANFQTYAADVQQPDTWGWGTKAKNSFTISAIRHYNTDPTDGTYAWSSPKVYHPLLGFDGQDPGMGNDPTNYPQAGNYLDLPAHGGAADSGAFMFPGGSASSVVEFVVPGGHGLRTGDHVLLTTNSAPPYPLFFPTDGHTPETLTGNNVSVATGSTAIVFTTPVTLNQAEIITFDGNASGLAYKVTGGSGNIYFIFPPWSGASSSTLNVTRTPGAGMFNSAGNMVVTGPDTLAFLSPDPIPIENNNAKQSTFLRVNRMVGTSQIPMSSSSTLSGTAAIAHNASTVTTSVAQFNQIGMSWVFSGDSTNTPYVITKCTLSATAAVSTSSPTSVTTSASVANQIGQTWTFTGDSSGKTYVVTGGSGTSWTIAPAYAGAANLTAAAVSTSGGDVNWTISGTYSGSTLTASTVTSSMSFQANADQAGTTLTYGFAAHMAAQWPGCACWIPMGAYMSDACIEAVADEMAPYLLANSTVILESGLEHWNFPSFPVGWLNQYYGTLMAYVPPNQVVNSYFTNPSSPGALSRDQAYVLTAAHMHDVFEARIATHNKGIQVVRMFGSFWADTQTSINMIRFGQGNSSTPGVTTKVPMGGLCVAVYQGLPTSGGANSTLVSACDPTLALSGVTASVIGGSTAVTTTISLSGELGQTWVLGSLASGETYSVMSGSGTSWVISPAWQGSTSSGLAIYSSSLGGNLAATQIHDIMRHVLKYSSAITGALASQNTTFAADYTGPSGLPGQVISPISLIGVPGLYGYESALSGLEPSDRQQLTQDLDYSPAMVDDLNTLFELAQDNGFVELNYFNIGGARQNFQMFSSIYYQQQAQGDGSTNVYSTIQGGAPPSGAPNGGYGLSVDPYNESVKLPTIRAWFAAANGSGPSFTVEPSRVQAGSVALELVGVGTTWSDSSVVTIQNSVTGATDVFAGTFTALSGTSATLAVTVGAGKGTWTITIDGVVSPPLAAAGANRKSFFGRMQTVLGL